jgi:hypothetical protein
MELERLHRCNSLHQVFTEGKQLENAYPYTPLISRQVVSGFVGQTLATNFSRQADGNEASGLAT